MAQLAYLDAETEAIQPRPAYPPKPVGFALELPGEAPEYLAFGHPTGNNCTQRQASARLAKVYAKQDLRLCFHNAKFDLDVIETHLALAIPAPARIEDTGVLGFFDDPRAMDHRLKTLAQKRLGILPDERDKLREWVLAHVPDATKKTWGAYIAHAPGDLVGEYAKADIRMTKELREAYHPVVAQMGEAYARECALVPVLMAMERTGVPVDTQRLARDIAHFEAVVAIKLDPWVRKQLKAPKGLELDSDDFLTYLESSGYVAPDAWVLTEKGHRSVSADALKVMLRDKTLLHTLQYRATLLTSLRTFMKPWHLAAVRTGGTVHPEWNQFKEKGLGTKSGRLSSSPNFQNLVTQEEVNKVNALRPRWLPELPRVRSYVTASPGYTFIDRDYNSQEYRLFAHYEEQQLLEAYLEDPWQDIHALVTDMVNQAAGTSFIRKAGKTLNFGMLYGQGAAKLAAALEVDLDVAKRVLTLYLELLPGVKSLREEMHRRDVMDLPITTLGGRVYHCEPPMFSKKYNRWQRFGYKLVNLLIQGGSADITKQAMINYHYSPERKGCLVMQVHDELLSLVKIEHAEREMRLLKGCMENHGLEVSVPMLTEGSTGPTFADLEKLPRGH